MHGELHLTANVRERRFHKNVTLKRRPHGNGAKCGNLSREVSCSILCGPKDCTQHQFGPHCEHQNCTVGPWSDSDGNICNQKEKEDKDKGHWHHCEEHIPGNVVIYGYLFHDHTVAYKRIRKVLLDRKGKGKQCPRLTQDVTCKYRTCEHQFWRIFGWNTMMDDCYDSFTMLLFHSVLLIFLSYYA